MSLSETHFPGESEAYRAARDELLDAEIALRRQTEAVAALRRALPPGGEVPEDYEFHDLQGRPVRLSALFGDHDTLIAYSYMFGPKMEQPCPMCTAMLDGLEGQVQHVAKRAAVAVIASSPPERIKALAQARGWRRLPLLSSAGSPYNRAYHGEADDGSQWPMMNVFSRKDGTIRHAWASEMMNSARDPGQDPRHVDIIWPLWNLLDLTPEGRGSGWYPRLDD